MEKSEKVSEPERRDWGIIIIILLIGFLCVIVAGSWALRFSPSWQLDTNMGSNIDPNSDFLTNKPQGFIEPVDAGILTAPGWFDLFLTPGALFATGTPLPPPPPATGTIPGTIAVPATFTPVTASPTNTLVWIPLPPTSTRRPPSDPPTNTPIPAIDLEISMNDGGVVYTPGGTITYTVIVLNNSASDATGAVVTDVFGAQITSASWTCLPSDPGATCAPAGGSPLNDTINLAAGTSVTYTITANVSGYSAGPLANTVTVTSAFETDPTDNEAMTSTAGPAAGSGNVNIGAGDDVWDSLLRNGIITMVVSPAIVGDGTDAYDFVYYERYAPVTPPEPEDHVDLDAVQILISPDGSPGSWTTVFNWGNGASDTNTNVALPVGTCGLSEDDNCTIHGLYGGTGVTIDIDSLGLTGSYPWIQIIAPDGPPPAGPDVDGGSDIDAIQPYYP